MTNAQKCLISDCKKELKYYNPLLRLTKADINHEKISENLEVATDYIEKAIEVISAIEELINIK